MKEKKKMPISLKNKIMENEDKFNIILNKKKAGNNKIQIMEDNKENKSQIINKKDKIYHDKNFLTEMHDDSISISSKNKKSNLINNKAKDKNEIKNKKQYIKKNYGMHNPLRNLDNDEFSKLNKYQNTYNTNYNKKISNISNYNAKKREPPHDLKNQRNNKNLNIFNNNKYNESYIIDSNLLDNLNNSIKISFNLNNMLERFEENQNKKKEKIQKLIKEKEIKEKSQYTYMPEINKNTKFNNKINDDFLTRQKKYNDIKNKNEKKLKEYILKNEQDKINKNSFILKRKNKDNSNVGNALNSSFISEISYGARSMADIDCSISRLFEWDNKRKEKLIKMQKEQSYELEKNKHIPRINKKSRKMAMHSISNKKENIFDRLAKEDEMVKEKKKILENLLSPTFKPNINLTFRRFDEENIDGGDGKKPKKNRNNKRNSLNNKEEFFRITVNRNSNIKPKTKTIKNNVNDIIEKENEKIENDEVYNMIRKMIIENINNKNRNKSV